VSIADRGGITSAACGTRQHKVPGADTRIPARAASSMPGNAAVHRDRPPASSGQRPSSSAPGRAHEQATSSSALTVQPASLPPARRLRPWHRTVREWSALHAAGNRCRSAIAAPACPPRAIWSSHRQATPGRRAWIQTARV